MMRFPSSPALGLLAFANSVFAGIGMGDLEIQSFKGEPLKAEVRIVVSSPKELAGAQAVLASRRVMDGYKPIRREWDYGDNFSYEIVPAGQDYVLRIQSSKPIRLDMLDVTLGVRYNGGDIYKDFSLPLKERSVKPQTTAIIAETAAVHAPTPKLAMPAPMQSAPVAVPVKAVSAVEVPQAAVNVPDTSVKTVEAEKTLPPPPISPRRGVGAAQQQKRITEKAVPEGSKLISLD